MTRRRAIGLVALAAGAALVLLTAAASRQTTAVTRHSVSPAIGRVGVRPLVAGPLHARPGSDLFSCQSYPSDGSAGPRCYSPQQIQEAYGYSGLLASGVDGTGVTIVIVDAYANPYVAADLQIQDAKFGLPDPGFEAVAPQGVPAFDPTDAKMDGWAEESTLDVLWAHAMAPAAKIVLVEAASNQDADILAATKWAVDNDVGSVVSQSYGESEFCPGSTFLAQEHAVFQEAVDKGITLFASSGDSGAVQWDCNGVSALFSVSTPAADPLVTSVGGTTLDASDPAGTYLGETAWTESQFGCNAPDDADVNCSGGGYSLVYGRPDYQQTLVGGYWRGVPDVSYDAGLNGGVLTHCGICNLLAGYSPTDPTLFAIFGGTSAGSPQWAALTADAVQMAGHPLGNINPFLYALAAQPAAYAADFHDITTGNNRVAIYLHQGYDAGPGWDPVTGLGTPNAAGLLPVLQGPPTNVSPPAVSGSAGVGQVLTTSVGSWSGSPTGYTYTWELCGADGTGCSDIAGATGPEYRLGAADAGHTVRSRVVAGNAGGSSAPAVSAPTAVVVPLPANTAPPALSGRTVVGRTLSATAGTWNTPATFAYHWLRCRPNGSSCRAISGATGSSYELVEADTGHTIEAQVDAGNPAGTTSALSGHSAVVVGKPHLRKRPRIAGRPSVGNRLRARKGIWRGPPSHYRYRWLRCNAHGGSCTPIKSAGGARYRVTGQDVGHRLRVRVTALNAAGKAKTLSRPSGVVH